MPPVRNVLIARTANLSDCVNKPHCKPKLLSLIVLKTVSISSNGITLTTGPKTSSHTTFIFATHDPQLMSHADEIFAIRDGQLLEHRRVAA